MRHCYFPVPKWLGSRRRRPVVGVAHRGEAVRVVALRRGRQAAVVARDRLDPPRADRRRPHAASRSPRSTRRSTRSCACCSRSGCTTACPATTTRSSPPSTAAWPGTGAARPSSTAGDTEAGRARARRRLEPRNSRREPADQSRMTIDGHRRGPGADPGDPAAGRRPSLSPSTRDHCGIGAKTGADFASLLTDAMNTQTARRHRRSTDAAATTGLLGIGSGLLSDLVSSLTGSGATTGTSHVARHHVADLEPHRSAPRRHSHRRHRLAARPTARPVGVTERDHAAVRRHRARPERASRTCGARPRRASDPNPASFDCSELTKWAAARSGVTIPDGAAHQYVWLKEQGATMSVQQALQTPGRVAVPLRERAAARSRRRASGRARGDQPRQRQDDRGEGPRVRRRHLRRRRPLQLRRHDPRDDLTPTRHRSGDGHSRAPGYSLGVTDRSFARAWRTVAELRPDRVAVVCGDRRLTFGELDRRAVAARRTCCATRAWAPTTRSRSCASTRPSTSRRSSPRRSSVRCR